MGSNPVTRFGVYRLMVGHLQCVSGVMATPLPSKQLFRVRVSADAPIRYSLSPIVTSYRLALQSVICYNRGTGFDKWEVAFLQSWHEGVRFSHPVPDALIVQW